VRTPTYDAGAAIPLARTGGALGLLAGLLASAAGRGLARGGGPHARRRVNDASATGILQVARVRALVAGVSRRRPVAQSSVVHAADGLVGTGLLESRRAGRIARPRLPVPSRPGLGSVRCRVSMGRSLVPRGCVDCGIVIRMPGWLCPVTVCGA